MSILIDWPPSPGPDIASYNLERSDNLVGGGVWTLLANIPHVIGGPNWDSLKSMFYYVDVTGDVTKYYRLISIDIFNQHSVPSVPFQPAVPGPTLPSVVKVDHNYPTPGNLRYQTAGGIPIEAAIIRAYKKVDFDLGHTDTPIAITMTDSRGNWVNPISLDVGFTYTIQFAKAGLYGPDKTEITV